MSKTKLQEYLESQKIHYQVIDQPARVFTAQEIAAATHIPGKELAKTVMVKLDGEMAMAVLPATHRINFDRLQQATGVKKVELASEAEFKTLFPDCEVGAMPPLGHLYGVKVYAAESLAEEIQIAFCAGTHTQLIRLAYKDFEKLANPQVLNFSYKGS